MPRNTRDRREPNKRVVHITNRCWYGLPFVPNRSVTRLIKGVLARGQCLYPVTICFYLFMGNHYHMIISGDANRVSQFANYIDAEIARRFLRLLPKQWGPTFWQGRFKEQLLPTPEAVIQKITYIACNPLNARLVGKLSTYPGASSIKSLETFDSKTSELCSFTFLRFFPTLKKGYLSRKADYQLSRELHKKSECFHEFHTDLFAWTKCFRGSVDRRAAKERIMASIKAQEDQTCQRGFIGAERLKTQPLDKPYQPIKPKGDRTPFVDCPEEDIRQIAIDSYRSFRALCRTAWRHLLAGLDAEWPRGAFMPSHSYCLGHSASG